MGVPTPHYTTSNNTIVKSQHVYWKGHPPQPKIVQLPPTNTYLSELHEDVEKSHLVGTPQGVQVADVAVEQVLVPLSLHGGHADV